MLFNSFDFAVFLPIVFVLYWFVTNKDLRFQNVLVVCASYVFYGWWDWRFLSLIFLSSIVDFSIGLQLGKVKVENKRKLLLWTSIVLNLGLLGFFKYYNFFVENFIVAFSFFGTEINPRLLNIILPVGISFYTFQTLSYTIDVYRNKLAPTNNFIAFAAFVSFFPQLVAGPIERANHLLPQFLKKRTFNYDLAVDGMRQILWGLFKKMVIADNCAQMANEIFNNSSDYNGGTLFLGALFFTFQIYGDFSGYSDIAIGTARLFGFDLKQNFAFPYFSRDIGEFWRRWHISLSTWFRDYLYIPLGGSRGGRWLSIRNVFIIFLVSGFWHGANWTFVLWGALNALFFLPLLLSKRNRKNMDTVAANRHLPSLHEFLSMLGTFALVVFAWIMFRAESVSQAFYFYTNIFKGDLLPTSFLKGVGIIHLATVSFYTLLLIMVEWRNRSSLHGLQVGRNRIFNWLFYLFIFCSIALFAGKTSDFIYFQF
jgi:D-alanyl-lipoteichoic acid acyltransferase DltB (MBOAT superfamily)